MFWKEDSKPKADPGQNTLSMTVPQPQSSLTLGRMGLLSNSTPNNIWQTSLGAGPTTGSLDVTHVVTPTARDSDERRSGSESPPADRASPTEPSRLPPPVILQRQPSEVSAWVSEVDSHYHSDIDDDDESTLDSRRSMAALSEVDSKAVSSAGTSTRRKSLRTGLPTNIVTNPDRPWVPTVTPTAVVATSPHMISPVDEERRHPTMAFVVTTGNNDHQTGGDDTSEDTRKNKRGYFVRSYDDNSPRRRKSTEEGKQSTITASEQAVLLQVWQQRASQAEERASSLTHRLSLEERLHRQVSEDLREAKWETSNLQDQVREQQARIHELEQQQRITQEWASSNMMKSASSSEQSSLESNHREHQIQVFRVTSELERSQKNVQELIRDLKRSQDKLLRVEHQKMHLLRELAQLQATQTDQRALAAVPHPETSTRHEELESELECLQAEVLELRASKIAIETRLQDSLGKEQELQGRLEQSNQDLSDLKLKHTQLEESHETLTKRVRFADEQLQDATQRQAALELRYSSLQVASENASRDYNLEVSCLKTEVGILKKEKQDLYATLQQALDHRESTQVELDTLKEALEKDKETIQDLSTRLECTVTSKAELEVSLLAQLQAQKDLLEQEQLKTQGKQAKWKEQLEATQQKVKCLQDALASSESTIESVEAERKALIDQQTLLQERLKEKQDMVQFMDMERNALRAALEQLQDDQATAATNRQLMIANDAQHKHLQSELEAKLKAAENALVSRQVEALKETRHMEEALQAQSTQVAQLEEELKRAQVVIATMTQEKTKLLSQVDELQILLSQEKRRHQDAMIVIKEDRDRLDVMVDSLKNENTDLVQRLASCQTMVNELERQLHQALEDQTPLRNEVNIVSVRANQLEETLQTTLAQADNLQAMHNVLQEEHTTLQASYQESLLKVQTLQLSKVDAANFISALAEERQVLQARVESLESQKSDWHNQLQQAQDRLSEVESSASAARATMQAELAAAHLEAKKARCMASTLVSQQNVIQKSHDEEMLSRQAMYEKLVFQLEASKDENTARISDLEATKTLLEEVNSKLANATAQLVDHEMRLSGAQSQKQSLSEQLTVTAVRIENLEKDLAASMAKADYLTTEHDTLLSVQSSLKQQLDATKVRVAAIVSERDAVRKELEGCRDENRHLISQLGAARSLCEVLEGKLANAEEITRRLEADAAEMRREAETLRIEGEIQVSSMRTELIQTRTEKCQVEEKLQKAEGSISSLKSSLAQADSKAFAAMSEAERLQQSQMTLLNQMRGLEAEIAHLSSSRDALSQAKDSIVTEYTISLRQLSGEFAGLEVDRDALVKETVSMKSAIESLTSEKALVEEKLEWCLKALAASQEELAQAKADVSKADEERDTAVAQKKDIEIQNSTLSQRMERVQTELDRLVSEKMSLSVENDSVKLELERAMADFRELEGTNRKTLVNQAKLESKNQELMAKLENLEEHANVLIKEMDFLQSEKAQLLSNKDALESEKVTLLAKLHREKEDFEIKLLSVETEKEIVAKELSDSRAEISLLDEQLKVMQNDAKDSALEQESLAEDLVRLQKERDSLVQRIVEFETKLGAVEDELKVTKATLTQAKMKLRLSEEENTALGNESCAAAARQIVLEAEVQELTAKVTSLELVSAGFQDEIRFISGENKAFAQTTNETVASLGLSREEEARLTKALASATKAVAEIRQDNKMLVSRLRAAEATVVLLKTEMADKDKNNKDTIEKLGRKCLDDLEVMRKMAQELKASEESKKGLKRAARYLLKRIRELEAQVGIEGTTINLPFSLASSTPDSKRSMQFFDSPKMDESFAFDEEPPENSTDLLRVAQQEITLEMQYHDKHGLLHTYDVSVRYTGPVMSGLPHGPGMLRFDNGDMFLGEFVRGEMDGIGVFARRQRHRHANQVLFGTFSHNEFKGDFKDVPPIKRVRVQHRKGDQLLCSVIH